MMNELMNRQVAAALGYDEEDPAPQLIAKGYGITAEEIIRIAEQHDVPIHENEDLAQVLSQLDLGQTIPEELFVAVAEVLAYVYARDASYQ